MARALLARTADLPAPGSTSCWTSLPGCAPALALAELAATGRRLLVLATSVAQAEALEAELRFFSPAAARIELFPDLEVLPYDSFSPHQDLVSTRLRILRELRSWPAGILVTAASTLLPRLAPTAYLERHAVRIATGQACSLEAFQASLEQAGYQRVSQVSAHGDYALRGSLVDFFPTGYESPARVDFLDDCVESIRSFDPDTQLSAVLLDRIDTMPARELPNDAESIRQFRQRYRRRFEGNPTESLIYREVSARRLPGGVESYLPLFFDQTATIWDYLPADTLVVALGDLAQLFQQAWQQVEERHGQLGSDRERPLLRPEEVYCPPAEHLGRLGAHPVLRLEPAQEPLQAAAASNLAAACAPLLMLNPREDEPGSRLGGFLASHGGRLLLAVESPGRREWLQDLLLRLGEPVDTVDGWAAFLASPRRVGLATAGLEHGVVLRDAGISILGEQELFGQASRRRTRRRRGRDPESIVGDLTDLRVGAPVVHVDHGVGRYVGLTRMTIGDIAGEFVTLEYAGGDRLHVPVSSLDLVSRYSGAAPELAPLHRLGTDQWLKARRRAAEKIRDVAAELLDLYSRRAARPGRSASVDAASYEAFAAGFPFALTDDQAKAIDDVLADLASPRPMDRLVCGDVGFGKTEVALRAAFTVVGSGHQVAVLVPTTLLAQQHHETFSDRFADWPVTVEVLSRFRTPQEHRQVLQRVAAGQVDIVIGTHRLLQKDVAFRDLGLVIVDEEHRFGVRHKEQLKGLRAEVDILTLTATPIPRTLNMALGDLRQLSLITTPPASRLAIRTFLSSWSAQLIREACLRELQRGGQIYFVHNRVQDIRSVGEKLAQIMPEARIEVAHGQMHERELERVMLDFYHRRFDILLCTAIVESGLDVPTANTIIIDQAEQFGLAQLHQLRGRVGRSHHQAFAYLLAPPREALQADALQRLEAMEALEDLGAGFVLATHDLEIRGAGELLGEGQSGQIQEIGFALYNEMLARTVHAMESGGDADPEQDGTRGPEIELQLPALLPEEYLPDIHLRLVLYKRIANAGSDAALADMGRELADRFGQLPTATANLLRVAGLRLRARELGIMRITAGAAGGSVEFGSATHVDPAVLVRLLQSDPKQFRLDPRQRLVFRAGMESAEDRLAYVDRLLAVLGARTAGGGTAPPRAAGVAS
ncbi:MAG: transcription-repair coupling factor [Proteobacteria bacterium]|nr:MAG: transcription-repair coupling factor [Pseudomonadota bacterium]MBC6944118.1 transcription-repair coupling factor [Gammaproteobacteria bacterium]MCQ3933478.1 transcription-repair coupling factor [Gammaproteobacteria bacterium]MDL1880436.1 transcription-repair coupling factor [Gammaproteobacteria bacterium PRO2]